MALPGPWPDLSTPLAGVISLLSRLRWRDLQQKRIVVVLTTHLEWGRLRHQVLVLGVAVQLTYIHPPLSSKLHLELGALLTLILTSDRFYLIRIS
jgi:hypothetical protein